MRMPLILFTSGFALIAASNLIFYSILAETNAKSSADQQFRRWAINVELFAIIERHRQFFPNSGKRRAMLFCGLAGILLLFTGFFAMATYSTG